MGKYSYVGDNGELIPLPYLDANEALAEVKKWVADFLRYNDMENYYVCLTYRLTGKGTIIVSADETNYFVVYVHTYCNMRNPDERRMHVWKLLCDADMIHHCRQAVVDRLEAASSEYEEILAAQDLGT